jgi:hypothetical protein
MALPLTMLPRLAAHVARIRRAEAEAFERAQER